MRDPTDALHFVILFFFIFFLTFMIFWMDSALQVFEIACQMTYYRWHTPQDPSSERHFSGIHYQTNQCQISVKTEHK